MFCKNIHIRDPFTLGRLNISSPLVKGGCHWHTYSTWPCVWCRGKGRREEGCNWGLLVCYQWSATLLL